MASVSLMGHCEAGTYTIKTDRGHRAQSDDPGLYSAKAFFAIFVLGMLFNVFMRWDSDPMLQYVFLLMCDSRLELV